MLLARNYKAGGHRPPLQRKPRNYVHVIERHYTRDLAARGRSRKDGFPTVGAVCDRPHFVNSRKNARSQTAPTIDTANSADFYHGLLDDQDRLCEAVLPGRQRLGDPLLKRTASRCRETTRTPGTGRRH